MADPIVSAVRGVASGGALDVNARLSQLREALQAQGGSRIGDDSARRITIDVGKGPGGSFGDVLTRALNEVSNTQDRAADYMEKFVRGEPVELHQVMAAGEEAGIALEMLIELRNKMTEAYRSVMSMQN